MTDLPLKLGVRFFRSETGNEPVREWLRNLPSESKKRIGADIKTLQYGWPIGMPVVRKLEMGLWEIRTHLEDGIARTFFTVVIDEIVLLHGFVKKNQKTPASDLLLAKRRKADIRGGR
ncbi:type II toxin-antitoxin system RelE/ParE family toxin [Pseudomonas asplenii]|uniref:type II toxin-antitoxin system RelE/ParE family toxin n=1 Tax=Pseudomonas asplenii TaxID=53407 RepID=UPI002362CEC2|nr:type II toxin-antitoxin system RelE/ParE family toxin [Pseudomonas asplenii]